MTTLSTKTKQSEMDAYSIKKQMAINFAQSLRKNYASIDYDTFMKQLDAYSKRRGIKHISKLKESDVNACYLYACQRNKV